LDIYEYFLYISAQSRVWKFGYGELTLVVEESVYETFINLIGKCLEFTLHLCLLAISPFLLNNVEWIVRGRKMEERGVGRIE
jgi:hypothetical protein